MRSFPIDVWGTVRANPTRHATSISRARVEAAVLGYLVITEEPHGTFDVWVETEDEAAELLATLAIDWGATPLA